MCVGLVLASVSACSGKLDARTEADLRQQLDGAGQTLFVTAAPASLPRIRGVTFVPLSTELECLLETGPPDNDHQSSFDVVSRLLQRGGVNTLVLASQRPRSTTTVRDHLRRGSSVPEYQIAFVSERLTIYRSRPTVEVPTELADVMAYVARAILSGQTLPSIQSFPEPIRRIRSVEVMVLIHHPSGSELYRSARGSSLGRALMTAAADARGRWAQRAEYLGRPLEDALGQARVEVWLLEEDGTLGNRREAFINWAVPQNQGLGIGFEMAGVWRYALPEGISRRGAMAALNELLTETTVDEDDPMARNDLRIYRLRPRLLATSAPAH